VGATLTGGHGVPCRQDQVYRHDSQRNSQPFLARRKSSLNAPQFGHCAMKVEAR
jgi:hypothetical protein